MVQRMKMCSSPNFSFNHKRCCHEHGADHCSFVGNGSPASSGCAGHDSTLFISENQQRKSPKLPPRENYTRMKYLR